MENIELDPITNTLDYFYIYKYLLVYICSAYSLVSVIQCSYFYMPGCANAAIMVHWVHTALVFAIIIIIY